MQKLEKYEEGYETCNVCRKEKETHQHRDQDEFREREMRWLENIRVFWYSIWVYTRPLG